MESWEQSHWKQQMKLLGRQQMKDFVTMTFQLQMFEGFSENYQ